MTNPSVKGQTFEERVKELEWELSQSQAECERLEGRVDELEEELDELYEDGTGEDWEDRICEIRSMLAREQVSDAIDYCDRYLPPRLRYAT